MTLPLRYITMLFPSPLPHLGFVSAMVQSSHRRLRWLRVSKPSGGHAPAQSPLVLPHTAFHAGKTSLQLVCGLVTSLFLMQSLGFPCLYFPATLVGYTPLPSHWMGYSSYLEVLTPLSIYGTSRLVGLSRPLVAILEGFGLFPSHWTVL